MARAPKRHFPKYVPFNHGGIDYVVDMANREVLQNWVSVERQMQPAILAACVKANPETLAATA
jgi:hypothetical protein